MGVDGAYLTWWQLATVLVIALLLGAALHHLASSMRWREPGNSRASALISPRPLRDRVSGRAHPSAGNAGHPHPDPDFEPSGSQAARSAARVLSHEIRTPLTLVRGAGELLAEETPGPLTESQRYFVGTIVDSTTLVIGMAEGFLLEARLEKGRLMVQPTGVDVRALVRETVIELRRIRHASVHLDSRGGPLILEVDAPMIRQVLWNLVNNAVRHAGSTAEVVVRVDATSEGATIEVGDDGPGMTPEHRSTVFADDTTNHPDGVGLGMGVIRRIVDAHGGRIVVDTLVRRGTRILIVLPWPARAEPS